MLTFPLNEFIEVISSRIPKDIKMVDYISDCISLGKDACYRRLRGEVEFSSSELFNMASALNISIDELIGIQANKKILVETRFIEDYNIIGEYNEMVESTISYLEEINKVGTTKIKFICNHLPAIIMGKHKMLYKLKFYKLLHFNLSNSDKFSDFNVPKELMYLMDKVYNVVSELDLEFILDKRLFVSIIEEINFFYSLGKITLEEINELRKEIVSFIDTTEEFADSGLNSQGRKLDIYSSHISIETSSIYVENKYNCRVIYNLYSADTIVSSDLKVVCAHKNSFNRLKKSCNLISSTGDIERVSFFNNLRNDLRKLPQ